MNGIIHFWYWEMDETDIFLGKGCTVTKSLPQPDMQKAYLYLGWLSRFGAMTNDEEI